MILINFLLTLIVINFPCETAREESVVEQIIDQIVRRTNISSMSCTFKSIYEDNDDYIEAEIEFAYQKGNLIKCIKMDTYKTEKDRRKEQPIESPLYELFFRKNVERIQLYTKNIHNDLPKTEKECQYIYQNIPYLRDIYTKGENTFVTRGISPYGENDENYNGYGYLGDPRWLIGQISSELFSSVLTAPLRSLYDFLLHPGRYYLYHKDEFAVLWHDTNYDDTGYLGAEIWIDSSNNVRRIRLGFFPLRVINIEEAHRVIDSEGDISCDSFSWITDEIELYDFREFKNGIRIPLMGVITKYIEDKTNKDKVEPIYEKYSKGEIDRITYVLETAKFRRMVKSAQVILQIFPETLIVNEEIDESIFQPPEPNITKTELFHKQINKNNIYKIMKPYDKFYSFIFWGICTTIVIIAIIISHRYFGWSI